MQVVAPPRVGAADARNNFVDSILTSYAVRSGSRVSDEVRAFMLTKVLEPDEVWSTRGINEDRTRQILVECLNEFQAGSDVAESTDIERAYESFYIVIHDRWHCPFPFIFC